MIKSMTGYLAVMFLPVVGLWGCQSQSMLHAPMDRVLAAVTAETGIHCQRVEAPIGVHVAVGKQETDQRKVHICLKSDQPDWTELQVNIRTYQADGNTAINRYGGEKNVPGWVQMLDQQRQVITDIKQRLGLVSSQ